MTRRNLYLSTALGLLIPLPVMLASIGLNAEGAPLVGWRSSLLAVFLLSLAAGLWRVVDPLYYAIALAVSFWIWVCAIAVWSSQTSSNLFGLAFILSLTGGVINAVLAGTVAWWLRRWRIPPWSPALPIIAAGLVVAYDRSASNRAVAALPAHLEEIRRAELAYAAGRPDHRYTCHGPDLHTTLKIEWRTEYMSSGTQRNQGEMDHYWIILQCSTPDSTPYFSARAQGLWKGGPRYIITSESPHPKRQ